jgi:chemotaxis protein methyltransferase CheR
LLRDELLPGIIAAKRAEGNLSLRIWSAGCSQGQEIYTIALMLHELLPDIENWRIHLLGTDINSEAVAMAIQGRYSDWSFRATPSELRERWFTQVGGAYEIHPRIRRMVHFGYLNLTEDIYPSILSETNAMDVILCRNVFIYLDRQAVQRSMAQYAECLLEHGALILGASDPVEYKHTRLSWVQAGRTAYFRKEPPSGSVAQLQRLPATVSPVLPDRKQSPASPIRMVEPARPVAPKQPSQPALDREAIIKLLKGSEWTVALAQIEEMFRNGKENSDLWQMKAKALASLGQTDKALQACETSLRLAHDNKHAYLIQGLILGELDREQESEQALRKALYLDHSFLEAHYELGMLRVRASDLRSGIKSLENALKLATTGEPERELHNAGGMTYRRFAQVLQNEISMLKEIAADKKPRKLRGS